MFALLKPVVPQAVLEATQRTYEEQLSSGSTVVLFGKRSCPRCVEVEELLLRHVDVVSFYDIDSCADKVHGDAMQDLLKEKTGGRTVPRCFIHGVFVGGCDDLQELDCAGSLATLVTSYSEQALQISLDEARPSRIKEAWPRDSFTIQVRHDTAAPTVALVVECDCDVKMLKRRAVEACGVERNLCDVLMLCHGTPFPPNQPSGAHARLEEGAVIDLIDRNKYHSENVCYEQFTKAAEKD